MPGFATHYVFGRNAYREIKSPSVRKIIRENKRAFSLGLQGPDLFFYYLPSSLGLKSSAADILHKKRTGEFFRRMIDTVSVFDNERDYGIAYAYIQGFMGHYILDTHIHPYVYSRLGISSSLKTLGKHFGLETDIDREVLMHYKGMHQAELYHASVISLTRHEQNVISRLICTAMLRTYGIPVKPAYIKACMVSFEFESVMLMDPNMQKHRLVNFVERHTLGYDIVSPLLVNECKHTEDPCNEQHSEWVNPWDSTMRGTSSVFEMMDRLQTEYAEYMLCMDSALKDSYNMVQDDNPYILTLLGNNSYTSGFDCRIRIVREP